MKNPEETSPQWDKWWHISFYATWLMLLTQIVPMQIADPDLWGRLSVPALFFQNNLAFPYTDPFSFTFNNQPWIDHEWLSGFVFYGAMLLFGEAGLPLLKYALAGATLWVIFELHRTVYERSPMYALYGVVLASPVLTFGYYATLRCQTFSFLFFALFIAILELTRVHKKNGTLKALVLLTWIWSWLHGGFVLGLILMALYLIGDWIENRKISITPYLKPLLIGIVAVSLLNPYGISYMQFLGKALVMERLHVGEWEPLPLLGTAYWEVKLMLLVSAILIAMDFFRQRRITTPMIVLLFAMAITLKAIRMQPFLALALIAYLPLLWQCPNSIQPVQRFRYVLGKLGPVLITTACALVLMNLHIHRPLLTTPIPDENDILAPFHYPVGAVHYLRQAGLSGNLMAPFPVGEFTYWSLYPDFKISIDGRFEEVYTIEHFMAQYRFYKQPWPEAVAYAEKLGADFILANQDFANHELFSNHPGWQRIYNDFMFVIYAQKKALAKTTVPVVPRAAIKSHSIGDFFTPEDRARFATTD